MRDLNVAGRDLKVDNSRGAKERPWLKIVLAVIGVFGAMAVAVIGSQYLPQMWHTVKGFFH